MDLDQLAVFLSLAKTKNFSRTAEALHVSQPTVSVRLAALENVLATALLERDKRNVRLTPAGITLIPLAERILRLAEECRGVGKASRAPRELIIGLPDSIWRYYAGAPITSFFTTKPAHPFSLVTGHSWEILDGIHDGTIHVGFSYQEPKAPFLAYTLWKEESVVVLAHRERAKELEGKSLEEIFRAPFIYLKNDALVSAWLDSLKMLPVGPRLTVDQMHIVHEMIRRNEGFSLLPISCFNAATDKDLKIVSPRKMKKALPRRRVYIVYRKGSEKDELVHELLRYLLAFKT